MSFERRQAADGVRGWRSPVPIPAAGAALLAVLVHLATLDNPFVYDDYRLIVDNPSLQGPSSLALLIWRDVTRPVVTLTYALDTAIWGRAPFGYHLTNLVLHMTAVLLVYWAALGLGEDGRRRADQPMARTMQPSVVAAATAVLFAVHPMLTQAVGYISGRSEVAHAVAFLLAFAAGRRWMRGGGARWWWACVGMWGVALLTKETAAMLPLVLLAYDFLVLGADVPGRRHRLARLHGPLIAAGALAIGARLVLLGGVEYRDTDVDARFAVLSVDAFWQYVRLFVLPRNQSIFHDLSGAGASALGMAASVGGLALLLALIWTLRRVHGVLAFGLLWFVLLLVPSSVLFAIGIGEPLAEHRAYLASAGLFLAGACVFALVWSRAVSHRRAALAVASAALVFVAQLIGRTLLRNAVWDDPVALARESVQLAPDHWVPRLLLADTLRRSGRCDQAVAQYEAAIALRPADAFAYTKLAGCLIEGRRLADAEQTLRRLRVLHPDSQEAALGLGAFAAAGNDVPTARALFEEVLRRDAAQPEARRFLALLDGQLSANDREQLCQSMRGLAGGAAGDPCLPEPGRAAAGSMPSTDAARH